MAMGAGIGPRHESPEHRDMTTTMKSCKTCKRATPHVGKRPNHLVHLIITVALGGFVSIFLGVVWAVVWAAIAMAATPPACTVCGTGMSRGSSRAGVLALALVAIVVAVSLAGL